MEYKDVTYNNMSDRLIDVLPELKEKYLAELEWWEGDTPGPHNIFGHQLLMPYIYFLLDSSDYRTELERLFNFVELLAGHPDKDVRDVVATTVMPNICGNKTRIKVAKKYLGENTKKICKLILGHEI